MHTGKIDWRSPNNYDTDSASLEAGLSFEGTESLTQQSFKDECDINEIVRRFGVTGRVPEIFNVPVSGDFTDVTDFTSAMFAVRQAQERFGQLPADLRARFENDPQRLIDFCEDGKNRDEAIKLGLIPKPAEPVRDAVKAIDELAEKMTAPTK